MRRSFFSASAFGYEVVASSRKLTKGMWKGKVSY
jgi:hypothetical protein